MLIVWQHTYMFKSYGFLSISLANFTTVLQQSLLMMIIMMISDNLLTCTKFSHSVCLLSLSTNQKMSFVINLLCWDYEYTMIIIVLFIWFVAHWFPFSFNMLCGWISYCHIIILDGHNNVNVLKNVVDDHYDHYSHFPKTKFSGIAVFLSEQIQLFC